MGLASPDTQRKHDLKTHMLPTSNHTQLGADTWLMSRKRTFRIPQENSHINSSYFGHRKIDKENVFKLARPQRLLG